MSEYRAPLRDMQFVLKELAGLEDVAEAWVRKNFKL